MHDGNFNINLIRLSIPIPGVDMAEGGFQNWKRT